MNHISRTLIILCVLAMAWTGYAREWLFDDFDAYAPGLVNNNPGWVYFTFPYSTRPASVSAARYNSAPHSLELDWTNAGVTSVSAVYTNFRAVYQGTNHPVIRVSFMAYFQNRKANAWMGIMSEAGGGTLWFRCDTNTGRAFFGFGNATRDLGVSIVTGRFANVALYYNMSDNTYAVDYDYTNVLAWTASDSGSVSTQFDDFVCIRVSDTAATAGQIFIDDVCVETFPAHTWAWWRCEYTAWQVVEQSGRIAPTNSGRIPLTETPSYETIYDGAGNDVRNPAAIRRLTSWRGRNNLTTPRTTNWTVETAFRSAPGANVAFMEWGTGFGGNTNGSYVAVGYRPAFNAFYYFLRDEEALTVVSDYASTFGTLAPDDRWHHVAFVKSNATLTLFLDYQPVATNNLGAVADGSYVFNTNTHACIGAALNNGNECDTNTVLDEVRFSGKALAPAEFLQPAMPLIASSYSPPSETNSWLLVIKTIQGRQYRVDVANSLDANAVWHQDDSFTATHPSFMFSAVSTNYGSPTFVRVRRQ